MTLKEAQEAISEMKAQGGTDEEIAASFYLMFVEDKLNVDQLNALVNLLGYHLTDEFLAKDTEAQKREGFKEKEPEDMPKETIEAAKDEKTNPVKEDEDEDEEKKAMKLFGK